MYICHPKNAVLHIWKFQCGNISDQLTHSMEQSPSWQPNRSVASQEFPCIVWNSKVHFHVHKCPPSVPILGQIYPFHASQSHCLKINFNIILPFTPYSSRWPTSLAYPHQNPVCTSPVPHTCHMPCSSHSSWFDHLNGIWWVQIIKLLII